MGCFCHPATAQLALQMPKLNVSLSLQLGAGAATAMGLSAWLSARGLPAEPWVPESAWLGLALPIPKLSVRAVATISALVQLRAQVLAQLGLDLLNPAHMTAFARIVATMNARLPTLPAINPLGWIRLAALNAAVDQVQASLQAGLLLPTPSLMLALTAPGGVPMASWASLLNALRALAPMIAACMQLGVSVSATAELAAALRVLAKLQLPALALPSLVASLTAALSAVAQLQASFGASLGGPVLELGLPAIQLRVQAKLGALMTALSARFGISLALPNVLAMLLAMLPKLPAAPGNLATSAVVQAALQAQALASVSWQVPSLPAISIGLATVNLVAQVQAVLGLSLVMPAPCGSGCDARALMQALSAA